jgi:trimeric autotransporter adhesin
MASTIKLKRGSGVPSGGSLAAGEPALDLTNNKLYSSTDGTDVVEIGTVDNLFIDITAAGGGDGTGRISIGNTDVTSSGSGVVAIGDSALASLSTSTSWGNVGIGYKAGQGITTGDSNICIGHQAGSIYVGGGGSSAPEIGTGFNNIILGFRAFPSTTNATDEITLGNAFHTNLRCNDTSISTLSDARDKTDIVDSTYGVEWLKGVKVRKYKWQSREGNGKDGLTRLGFIAQELQEACGECNAILDIVQENNPDQLEIKMSNLIPILTKAIQELAARVEELEAN